MGWGKRARRGGRPKKTRAKGKSRLDKSVVPVDRQLAQNWEKTKTAKQNYIDLGLAVVPGKRQRAPTRPIELVVPEPPPKREPTLTYAEIINCREMLQKHGQNYLKMFRDIKVNRYQHTQGKLEKMCELYLKDYADRDPLFKGLPEENQ